jgi:hypothetical protein
MEAFAIPLTMPLDAPVTIATLSDSLLLFTMVLLQLPTDPNVHRCESHLALTI